MLPWQQPKPHFYSNECHVKNLFENNATLAKFDIYTLLNNLIKGKDPQPTCIKLYSAIL